MIYVLDKNNNPLMPTSRNGKVRHLLKDGKAIIVKIIKNLKVPTGNICIIEGEKGKLEFLSIGNQIVR